MFIAERLISIVAPHHCLVCGNEGKLICNWCAPDAFSPVPPRCYLCHKASNEFLTCEKCRSKSRLKHVWVNTEYSPLAKQLIKAFKFERAQAAAPVIANYQYASLPYLEDYFIIPVPTASSRVRQRGYDHTKLLARELAKQLHLPVLPYLARLGQSRQVGLKREQRLKQLKGAFKIKQNTDIKGFKILLIDDVLTTGTTLNEAAKVLRNAGAKEVSAVVFAQTR